MSSDAEYLLEANHIRINLLQDLCNPLGTPETVKADTLVDVIGHYP